MSPSRRAAPGRAAVALAIVLALSACDRSADPRPQPEPSRGAAGSESILAPLEDIVRHVENLGTATLSAEAAKRLVFVAVDIVSGMIVGFDEGGDPLGPLATDPSQKFDLAASADGSRIAFARRFDKPIHRHDVVTMNRDGSDKRLLTRSHPDIGETELRTRRGEGRWAPRYERLAFAPDGRSLLVFAQWSDRREGVFRLAADGSTLDPVAVSTRGEDGAVTYRFPAYARDGRRFACARRLPEADGAEPGVPAPREGIAIVSVDDLSETIVHRSPTGDVRPLDFSPDGASLLVVESDPDAGSRLVVVPLVASGPRVPRTVVTGRNLLGSFSPDGKSIVYSAERADTEDLHVVPAEGGEPRRLTRSGSRVRDPIWLPAAR
jgi:hypothetical protein